MLKLLSDYKDYLKQLHSKSQALSDPKRVAMLAKMQAEILAQGDTAVIRYLETFDNISPDSFSLNVTQEEIKKAHTKVPSEFKNALKQLIQNVTTFHQKQKPKSWTEKTGTSSEYGMHYTAIDHVGLYVPGGVTPYPSSVVMDAIPAKIAGCERIVLITPPQKDGSIAPQILVAADLCGVTEIYKVGGAQGIFALAHGTQSIPKVDKIVGPGNIYVATAKQMVYGVVDIDKPAGPSEVCVYVDSVDYATKAATELLAQCEHDADNIGICVSESKDVLLAVQSALEKEIIKCKSANIIKEAFKNSALILTKSCNESIDVINQIATEHLALITDKHKNIQPKIKHAGAIFCGPYTSVTLGDFYAGPNHVLPTAGAARFSSALSVMDFMKFSSVLTYSKKDLNHAAPYIKTLTDMEGFDGHYLGISSKLD